jgi:hypothetical protein
MRYFFWLVALLLVGCSNTRTIVQVVVTSTPLPTLPATATLEVSPTSETTPTPEASPTREWNAEDEEDYRQFVRTTAVRIARGMLVLVEQSDAASRNVTLMLDEDWIEREMEGIADVREVAADIQERQPPPQFQEFHDQYIQVGVLLEEAMTLYTEAVDELDARKLERGAGLIREATEIMGELDVGDLQ